MSTVFHPLPHEFLSGIGTSVPRHQEIREDGRGCCTDDAFTQRLWKSVKYGNVYLRAYVPIAEVNRELRTSSVKTVVGRSGGSTVLTPDAVCLAGGSENVGEGGRFEDRVGQSSGERRKRTHGWEEAEEGSRVIEALLPWCRRPHLLAAAEVLPVMRGKAAAPAS